MTTRRRFLQTVAVAGVSSCVRRIAAADRQQSSLKSISPASILIDCCTMTSVGPGGPGSLPTGAPTDPYVRTLAHTVPQITVSLRACRLNAQYTREPTDMSGEGV